MRQRHVWGVVSAGVLVAVVGACKPAETAGTLGGTQRGRTPPGNPCVNQANQKVDFGGTQGDMVPGRQGRLHLAIEQGASPKVAMAATDFGGDLGKYSGKVVQEGKVVDGDLGVQTQGNQQIVVVQQSSGAIPIGRVIPNQGQNQGGTVQVTFEGYGTCVAEYKFEGKEKPADGGVIVINKPGQDPGKQDPHPGQQNPGKQDPNPGQQNPGKQDPNPGQQDQNPGQQQGGDACANPANQSLPLEGYANTTMTMEKHPEAVLTAVTMSAGVYLQTGNRFYFSGSSGESILYMGGMYRNGRKLFGQLLLHIDGNSVSAWIHPDALRPDLSVSAPVKVGTVEGWAPGQAMGAKITIRPAYGSCLVKYKLSGAYTGYLSGGQGYWILP